MLVALHIFSPTGQHGLFLSFVALVSFTTSVDVTAAMPIAGVQSEWGGESLRQRGAVQAAGGKCLGKQFGKARVGSIIRGKRRA